MTNDQLVLVRELKELRDFLVKDGDKNWVRGIERVITILESPVCDVQKAFEVYSGMLVGKESFADYFAWDQDSQVMDRKNQELKSLKASIGEKFSAAA